MVESVNAFFSSSDSAFFERVGAEFTMNECGSSTLLAGGCGAQTEGEAGGDQVTNNLTLSTSSHLIDWLIFKSLWVN